MEYAFLSNNVDYLYKASLAFYVDHGTDPNRQTRYAELLADPTSRMVDFKQESMKFMPKVTTILNIEYETKRKFYYYSDDFINNCFKLTEKRNNIPTPLERLYKILDYRDLFLAYLTSTTLAFYKGKDKNGEPNYLAWWERLRNTKHDGEHVDGKLLRDYSYAMDKRLVQKRAINAIASSAVYEDNIETSFVSDLSDLLADVSDNKAHKMGQFTVIDENGIAIDKVYGSQVSDYQSVKAKKDKILKNRKKRNDELKQESD
jgi:hypothetical protein